MLAAITLTGIAFGIYSRPDWTELARYFAPYLPAALVLFVALKATIGLRVSRQEELSGLDIGEHGMEAYSGFQFFTTQ